MKNIYRLLSIGILLTLFSGCTSTTPILNVKVIAGNIKTPLPIHFFTLKSNNQFKKLDYFELTNMKKHYLNNDLVNRTKTILAPGKTEIFQVHLNADIQYFALVIGYKDIDDNDNWRYLQAVNSVQSQNIALKLGEVNNYTSRALKKTTLHENNSPIKKVDNKINKKISTKTNSVMNSAIDSVFKRIF